jgi:hypothetical protein
MRKLFLFCGIAVLALSTSSIASADNCTGVCGTDTANGVVTNPPGLSSYSYVTTAGAPSGGGTLPAAIGSAGVISTNGSTYTTSAFSATAGELINFEFNYVTSDGSSNYPDYSWAALMSTDGGSNYLVFSAQTQPTGNTVPGQTLPSLAPGTSLVPSTSAIIPGGPAWNELGGYSGLCYAAGCGYTGWIESEFTGEAADNYVLEFGVSNASDIYFDSGLAFAGVDVGGAPITPPAMPEPSSLVLLGSGLIGLAGAFRRKVLK